MAKNPLSISRFLFTSMLAISVVCLLAIGCVHVLTDLRLYRQESKYLSEQYFDSARALLRSEVEMAVDSIRFERARANAASAEDLIKRTALERLSQIRFGKDGYVFVGQWDGVSLLGPAKGRTMWDVSDADGVKIVQELIRAARSGGGFVRYVMPKLDGKRDKPKLSYAMGVPEWQWYVGAGMYVDEIQDIVDARRGALSRALLATGLETGGVLLLILAAAGVVARLASGRMQRGFAAFSRFFDESASTAARINPRDMAFREFASLAESANRMAGLRREAEDARRREERRYKQIVENITDGLIIHDFQTTILDVNDVLCRMLGYERSELVGATLSVLKDTSTLPVIRERMRMLHEADRVLFETTDTRKDGTPVPVEVSAKVVSREGTGVIHAFVRDCSARLESERRIRFQARLLDEVSQAVIATDRDGRVIYGNRMAEQLYGVSAGVAAGRHPEGEGPDIMEARRSGKIWSGEFTGRGAAGETFPIQASGGPIFDGGGRLLGAVGVSFNVTDRKAAEEALRQSEERLQQAQKMEAVGRLAGGVAHDFNNLLTVISGFSSLALEKVAGTDPLRGDLEEIGKAARRAGTLTYQLLAFSRKQVMQPRLLALDELIAGMEDMLCRLLGEDIRLRPVRPAGLWKVMADPGKLEQVVMNLAVNARDAMPGGGTLHVETANVVLGGGRVGEYPEAGPGEYVLLTVSDTGVGMEPAALEHLFEPFFTTKERGKGTGLGLPTVYGIVKQSGGFVSCASQTGKGTTFKILLPRSQEDSTEAQKETEPVPAAPGGSETILLVEDDPQVRSLAVSVLQRAGYKVVPAEGGKDALSRLPALRAGLDLLITDVVMPGMDGQRVARQISVAHPLAKVIFVSGYTENIVIERGVTAEGFEFLPKPFTARSLLLKVRSVLDSR